MTAVRRAVACVLLALSGLAASAAPTWAHAALVSSAPRAGDRVEESPSAVVLRFSEPVQVVNRSDVTVVDHTGRRVDLGAPRTAATDARQLVVPLHQPLLPDSYTVRFRVISDDSHPAAQALVYATGGAALKAPVLGGTGGLSDTGATAVAVRVAELAALGLLVGLIAFRMLVWDPAVAGRTTRELGGADRETVLIHGRRLFWRAFWALAVIAGAAEATVLGAKTAVVFHTGLVGAALRPGDAYRLVSASRFGDVLGLRYGALLVLVAVAFATWSAESAAAPSTRRRGPLALMGMIAAAALALVATQGHASQAPFAPLQMAADAIHLGAVAFWVGGLPWLVAVLVRAPRALPGAGRGLACATLARFSCVALWSVVTIAVTGLVRVAGELSSPAELWTTDYGRNVVLKVALLCPILVVAARNRRVVAALSDGMTPSAARLRAVARTVQIELTIAIAIVAVAALLVAEVPGRG